MARFARVVSAILNSLVSVTISVADKHANVNTLRQRQLNLLLIEYNSLAQSRKQVIVSL